MRGLAVGCVSLVAVIAVGAPAARGAGDVFVPTTSLRLPSMSGDGLASGDFNGDGRADIAAWHWNYGDVYTLLGNGDGTFSAQAVNVRLPSPTGGATGDVNRDGFGDVVFITGPRAEAQVYFGGPGGALAAGPAYGQDLRYGVALRDLNGDGHADLITTYGDDVVVQLNNGAGAFGAAAAYPAATNPGVVVVRDLNRDGIPDVTTTDVGDDEVVVLLGRGDGTLGVARSFPSTLIDTRYPAPADFDGDGKVDVAVSGGGGDLVEVHFGTGDGNLERRSFVTVGGRPEGLAAGDFNGDGRSDLVTLDMEDGTLKFLAGLGDGTFAPPDGYATPRHSFDWSRYLLSADFNGDGRPDVATLTDMGYLSVQVSVPEPAAAACALAAAPLLCRRRRRAPASSV